MTELKNHQLLSGLTVQTSDAASPHLDIESLADQLVEIANELRAGVGAPPVQINGGTLAAKRRDQRPSLPPSPANSGFSDPMHVRQLNAQIAREIYSTRRRRSTIFGNPELFGEPAWDILLDLYVAHVEGKPVSVSSACIGSAAPPTTGLRWLGVLAEHDLILREHDPDDQRRVLVRLTEEGLAAMDEFFASTAAPA
ncbi:winged helix DNA-binding protein [uncultured Erythrobacter sp.]|uniref:winged helix DNA-binding protein n=1 Tax=uncultured Erythrobacter sp. TaxID=263913 RepID=UPI00262AC695|nr:winged helix DNA-binding protein [uncultured Erythrobacter sp.]